MRSAGYKEMSMRIPFKEIEILHDAKLQFDSCLKKYFLIVCFEEKKLIRSENQTTKFNLI